MWGPAILKARTRLRNVPLARTIYRSVRFMGQAVADGLWRLTSGRLLRRGRSDGVPRQEVLTWKVNLPGGKSNELREWLRRQGYAVNDGRHMLYLPPQPNLDRIFPSVKTAYPSTAGFKILKGSQSPATALVPANYLYARGLGPRAWDLTRWSGEGRDYTVFVVNHVIGRPPTVEEATAFRDRLATQVQSSHLRIPDAAWRTHPAFLPPDCAGNLLVEEWNDRPMYVGLQNMAVLGAAWTDEIVNTGTETLHFGGLRPLRNTPYLYQRIPGIRQPGKRNTEQRWSLITDELAKLWISVAGRAVLDFGCNSGMMLHSAMAAGAAWGVGWDLPPIADLATELLHSLGTTRFTLVGCNLNEDYQYLRDVPSHLSSTLDESVVLYLAVREHVGLVRQLGQLRWRALVYEGHQGERLGELEDHLRPLLNNGVAIVRRGQLAGGYSSARPFAILLRT
jgi:hypothetical protein